MTEGTWKMIKSVFDNPAWGGGNLFSLPLLGKLPEVKSGSPAALRPFILHALPPGQEIRRQWGLEWRKHLSVPNTHNFAVSNNQAVRQIKFESKNIHSKSFCCPEIKC